MRSFSLFVVTLCALFSTTLSLRILGVFSHNGKSHFDMYRPLLRALAKKGHQVTVISFFPEKEKLANYEDVTIDTVEPLVNIVEFNQIPEGWLVRHLGAYLVNYFAASTCAGIKSKVFQDFVNSDRQFDVIIAELFNSNCYIVPVVKKFKAPLVGIISNYVMPWQHQWFGNPDNPSYIPNIFQGYTDQMTFWQRLNSVFGYFNFNLFYKYVMKAQDQRFIQEAFGIQDDIDDIMKNTSILLITTHYTNLFPRPMVPQFIEVAGIHLGKVKPLPKDLEEWITGSPDGVILMSMGSLIKGATFPEEKKQAFLRAFARLPQRILWKYENDTMPGKPPNVLIRNWTPQFDVLCHPNVKAFISHGGNLGLTEAVHCGTPVIIMPQFGDQFLNGANLERNGGGVVMKLKYADEETLYNNLKKVLDPSFQRQAKELSARFADRPLPPLDTAIYWVEYAARHHGAHFMKTAALNMPFYQYLLLDIIAFCLLCLIASFFILRSLYRFFFKRKSCPYQKVKTN